MAIDLPRILQLMVNKKGADLFFHTGARITLKTPDGFLQMGDPLKPGMTEQIVREHLSDKKMSEFDANGELDFSLSYGGIGRFRCNAFRQRGEVSLVMRHVKTKVPSITELGMPKILKQLIMQRHGLIIVVGATGSGKSTTLAAMIDYRNTNSAGHILTLEDPIEFIHDHKKSIVAQREVGVDTETFGTGMRSALRESPDVILLGEIRDNETMEYSLKFANTGHLALSTLHANNAVMSLERILGFFEKDSREQLCQRMAQNLRAVICQRLAPKKGGGNIAVAEIMINTPYIADLIEKMEFGSIKDAIEKGSNYGMQSFDQHLVQLYLEGMITEETAFEYADSRSNVKIRIRAEDAGKRLASEMNQGLDSMGDIGLTPLDE